jgi:hypothetical protein
MKQVSQTKNVSFCCSLFWEAESEDLHEAWESLFRRIYLVDNYLITNEMDLPSFEGDTLYLYKWVLAREAIDA